MYSLAGDVVFMNAYAAFQDDIQKSPPVAGHIIVGNVHGHSDCVAAGDTDEDCAFQSAYNNQ